MFFDKKAREYSKKNNNFFISVKKSLAYPLDSSKLIL